ncbi:hypothetical protein [Agarivorans sp. DSG3-1]|uniref:hypothetical protein n=1 Tax=Agarivorans sp. DSG3-1 TaxID=3342249 RepID=UPI00398EBD37
MKVKRYLSSMLFLGGWLYINYQIYLGATTGEFNPIGRGVGLVSYDASPIWFYITIGLTIIFSVIYSALILWFVHSAIDRKVRAYGGNYNANTFKAILRGLRK